MDAVQNSRRDQVIRKARAEAAVWIVRLHGPHRCPEMEAGFRAWLTGAAENAEQFELVTEVWDAGTTPVPGIPRITAIDAPRRHRSLVAAIALLALAVGGWGVGRHWLHPSFTTGIGEQRVIRLSDGSRVTLNANSRIQVTYRSLERRVSLDRGEAFFDVTKDASRPFRVSAGDHQVEALGTSFVVRREAERVTVSLVEGKVAVTSTDHVSEHPASDVVAERNGPITLEPGQRLRLSAAATLPAVDAPGIDSMAAWRRGEILLDDTPLADAAAEMNRYDQRQLIIADPQLARIRISGIYHTGDTLLFAKLVARLYGVEIAERDDEIHLISAEPDGAHAR